MEIQIKKKVRFNNVEMETIALIITISESPILHNPVQSNPQPSHSTESLHNVT